MERQRTKPDHRYHNALGLECIHCPLSDPHAAYEHDEAAPARCGMCPGADPEQFRINIRWQ